MIKEKNVDSYLPLKKWENFKILCIQCFNNAFYNDERLLRNDIVRTRLWKINWFLFFRKFNKIDRKHICKRHFHNYLHGYNHSSDFISNSLIQIFRELINISSFRTFQKRRHHLLEIDFRHFLRDIGDRKRTFAEFHADYGRNIYIYNVEKWLEANKREETFARSNHVSCFLFIHRPCPPTGIRLSPYPQNLYHLQEH